MCGHGWHGSVSSQVLLAGTLRATWRSKTVSHPDIFRSVLWMGAFTANMLNQLLWLFGADLDVPLGPWQQIDMAAQWAAEVEELMPSLYGPFGVRDTVTG